VKLLLVQVTMVNPIDNCGGDTTGKSSEFGFYVAGSYKDGKWERYRDSDDCTYEMTDWFPKKVNPVRDGIYEIDTGKKNEWPNTVQPQHVGLAHDGFQFGETILPT
jgi:hypothetical protein